MVLTTVRRAIEISFYTLVYAVLSVLVWHFIRQTTETTQAEEMTYV